MSEAGHKKVTVPMLEVTGLKRTFDVSAPWLNRVLEGRPRSIVRAVDGVNFSINKGETFSLVGESGCGKSTVARLIVGLYEPTAGTIRFDGVEIGAGAPKADRRRVQSRMQMIFQDPYASLNPRWRVSSIIAEPMRAGGRETRERAEELLRQVGLAGADAE